jgi:hypothetical protein
MILRKEDKTMKYLKPEIAVLGEAVNLIESTGNKPGSQGDGTPQGVNTAYDLDE